MIEVEKLNTSKEKILSTISLKGPSLPVSIAREINFSPLFAGAFLSELKAEGKIKLSNMRVGSSPLYFIPGQEPMLEKFVPYLNEREKEAFHKLKQEKLLEDSEQSPIVRVALRSIKDFAIPINTNVNGESKLFWKYFVLPDEELNNFFSKKNSAVLGREEKKEEINDFAENKSEISAEKPLLIEENRQLAATQNVSSDERPLAERKKEKLADNGFVLQVKDYLGSKDIEILHVVLEKKKEFEAKIRVDGAFGKTNFYLIAKDKVNVSDTDLANALTKARAEKLPAVLMCPGDLNKKGRRHLEEWGNLVKFEKLRLGED